MNKYILSFSLIIASALLFSFDSPKEKAITEDPSVQFSVTTSPYYGAYGTRHIMAVWVTDANNKFVKTLKKRAAIRQQYLSDWLSSSFGNTTDAITGATLFSHETHNLTWDCSNAQGVEVADGGYVIKVELTDDDKKGYTASYAFTKGAENKNLTPADEGPFSNVTLDYIAPTTGIDRLQLEAKVTVYPNPIKDIATITIPDELTQNAEIAIYDMIGNKIKAIPSREFNSGVYNWNGADASGNTLSNGIYLLKVASPEVRILKKLLLIK